MGGDNKLRGEARRPSEMAIPQAMTSNDHGNNWPMYRLQSMSFDGHLAFHLRNLMQIQELRLLGI
jgi:hypothetical protein